MIETDRDRAIGTLGAAASARCCCECAHGARLAAFVVVEVFLESALFLESAFGVFMPVDARPVTIRPHPSHTAAKTEGTSSLLADDAAELPGEPDDLELPSDFELQTEGREEVSFEDDIEGNREGPEVEDTPGDDALIAQARIDRFDDAHNNSEPVDMGPFAEIEQNSNDDKER